jgi:adenylate cyclase
MATQDQPTRPRETGNEELWRTIFDDGHPDLKKQHGLHRLLPRDPRCRLCLAPFSGLGGWWMGRRGKKPSSRNPHYCSACDGFLEAFPGGAEVNMSLLFVDIRNSTEFANNAGPADVQARVTPFWMPRHG